MDAMLKIISVDHIAFDSFIVYFSDGSFVTVLMAEFLTKFPDRFWMGDLGHPTAVN
jgi:hypothetical protein